VVKTAKKKRLPNVLDKKTWKKHKRAKKKGTDPIFL